MTAPSRQLRSLHRKDLERLRALIPAEVPVDVTYDDEARQFVVCSSATREPLGWGRYQVAHAFLTGYLRGWADREQEVARLTRRAATLDDAVRNVAMFATIVGYGNSPERATAVVRQLIEAAVRRP